MHASTRLVSRALDALQMTADEAATLIGVSRALLDTWTLAPDTMPFPVRAALAACLLSRARNDQERQLAAVLLKTVALDITLDEARFTRELRGLTPVERESRWNDYLASPMLSHPGQAPVTLADVAARKGVTVESIVRSGQ